MFLALVTSMSKLSWEADLGQQILELWGGTDKPILPCLHGHGIMLHGSVGSSALDSGSAGNTLRPRQNRRHFPDDMWKYIFWNWNVWIPIEISLKFVLEVSINYNPSLFQIMDWRRPGDKPFSESMMVSLLTHICVTRPQWVKYFLGSLSIMSRIT